MSRTLINQWMSRFDKIKRGGSQHDIRRIETAFTQILDAYAKGRPFGEIDFDNPPDYGIVAEFESVSFIEDDFRERIFVEGQEMRRHRNGGGLVPVEQSESDESKPFVADTAYVGPNSMVRENARVTEEAYLTSGFYRSYRGAIIAGRARVSGRAKVVGAHIAGDREISGDQVVTAETEENASFEKIEQALQRMLRSDSDVSV